jgi:hypothetical protein
MLDWFHCRLGQEAAAIDMYEQGLALDKAAGDTKLNAYIALGELHRSQKSPQRALEALSEAFQISPDHSGLIPKLTDLFREEEHLVEYSYFQAQIYTSMYGILKAGMELAWDTMADWFKQTCNDKLLHDIAQLEELLTKSRQQGQAEGEMHNMLERQIIPALKAVVEENSELKDGGQQVYYLTPQNWKNLNWFYNRAVYTPGMSVPASTMLVDAAAVPDDFRTSFSQHKIVAVEGLLTQDFAIHFGTYCQEATMWHGFNHAKDGYLTSKTGHGLDSELLARFVMQVKEALPVLHGTRFRAAWAAKHLHTKPVTGFHIDGGDIMVKVWLQDQRYRASYTEGTAVYARTAGAQWLPGVVKARIGGRWSILVNGSDEPQLFHKIDLYPGKHMNGPIMHSAFLTRTPPLEEGQAATDEFATKHHLQNITIGNPAGSALVYSKLAYAHFSGPSDVAFGQQSYMQHAVELTLEFDTKEAKKPKEEL